MEWNGSQWSNGTDQSNWEKWSTSKGGPIFLKLFQLNWTDPFSFRPKFPEILFEWIAPQSPSKVFRFLLSVCFDWKDIWNAPLRLVLSGLFSVFGKVVKLGLSSLLQRTDSLSAPGVCLQSCWNTAEDTHKIWRIRNNCASTSRRRMFPQLVQFSGRLVCDRKSLLSCWVTKLLMHGRDNIVW